MSSSESRQPEPHPTHASGFSLRVAWVLTLLGLGLPFLIMSNDRRWWFSVPVGLLGCAAASAGLLRLLGAWNADPAMPASPSAERSQTRELLQLALSALAFVVVVWLAVRGVLPAPRLSAAILITATFLWLVVAVFRTGRALGVWSDDVPLLQRYGFWLIAASALLYLPGLGNFSLIDPWETHYGEVAREMLSRDDWISLWWAHDGWFWSKPILNFWIQGLSFKLFGVPYSPDEVLSGIAHGRWPQPEWACRMPIFLMTLVGSYVLYRSSIAAFGRRAAFLGGLVLLTCPYWYILARQSMADMPYVAPLTAGMGFLLLGFQTDPEARLRDYTLRVGRFRCTVNAFHLLFVVILLCLLPQVLYLFSRNLTLHTTDLLGFRPHLDELSQGSPGGNCGQPGNRACTAVTPAHVWGQPAAWAVLWLGLGLGYAFFKRKERRTQRVLFIAGWLCTAIAVMGKGAPGLVLPLGTALVFTVVSGRFRDLLRLELPALLLLLCCIGLPWYVQMVMRHGSPFFERLVLHDMVKRAFAHVHDTNKGDDVSFRYYVWQLGYGLFPWTGLCAGGLIWWAAVRRRTADWASSLEGQAISFFLIWWTLTFGMFSVTLTKFHHYIFPLVPPTAALTGLFLAHCAPRTLLGDLRRNAVYLGAVLAGVALIGVGIVIFLPGNLGAVVPDGGELPPPQRVLGIALGCLGLGCLGYAFGRVGRALPEPGSDVTDDTPRGASLACVGLAAALAVALAGRDLFITREGDVAGPARILHLFTYNYARSYPETLEFSPGLFTFTLLAGAASLSFAVPWLRRHAVVLASTVAGLFAIWCMNVYLIRIAPHWGQRETMVAYYQHRAGPEEPLVAYQMNWKGENFYTGNRMATFVSSGAKFKQWIERQRKKGVRTMFFTTEHTRINSLKRELDKPKQFEVLTDARLNNKFLLAKVVFDELPAAKPGTTKPPARPAPKPRVPPSTPTPTPTPTSSADDPT